MAKQAYRYKATAVIKFSVEDLFHETEEEAREIFCDDLGGELEWAQKNGNTEILELSIENLGPGDADEYFKKYWEEEGNHDKTNQASKA